MMTHRAIPHRFLVRVMSALLVLTVLVVPWASGQGHVTAARSQLPRRIVGAGVPSVDVAAFRRQGRLAFLWGSRLYVLDGDRGTLRAVARPHAVVGLSWSPDGQWLAYIRVTNQDMGSGQLWVVRADGSQGHQIMGLPTAVQSFSWSPVADALAVALTRNPGMSRGLWLASPTGSSHRVAGANISPDTPVVWSPDGRTWAYSVMLPFKNVTDRSDALYTMPATGQAAPVRRYVAQGSGIQILGWWSDSRGLLFWRDPQHSASLAADGVMLFTLPLGGTPRAVTTTLAYPDWVSLSPSGRTLLLVAGAGRAVWHDKRLATCGVQTGACQVLPQQPGLVQLDPAWSPRGNHIAFVAARDRGNAGDFGFATRQDLLTWVRTHTLWVAAGDGSGAHELTAAGAGVYQPQWSADGRHLLYLRDDAVWLIPSVAGTPVRVVGPFPGAPNLFGFYGHPSFPITLAWYRW